MMIRSTVVSVAVVVGLVAGACSGGSSGGGTGSGSGNGSGTASGSNHSSTSGSSHVSGSASGSDGGDGGPRYTGSFMSTDGITATISGPSTFKGGSLVTYASQHYILNLGVDANDVTVSSPAGVNFAALGVNMVMNAAGAPPTYGSGPLATGTYTSSDGSSCVFGGGISMAFTGGIAGSEEDFVVNAGLPACFCAAMFTGCMGSSNVPYPASSYSITITSVGTGESGTVVPHGTLTATMVKVCSTGTSTVECDGGSTTGKLTLNF